jgi:hypothetical protein
MNNWRSSHVFIVFIAISLVANIDTEIQAEQAGIYSVSCHPVFATQQNNKHLRCHGNGGRGFKF